MDTVEASKKNLLETFNNGKSKQLNELRKENEFCDLTLKCEDGLEIKVHRVVLSSASNYFKDLLTLPMRERFEESILLPDITADVLEKIITFIYTSVFEEKIEDVEKIIKYAAVFQLQQLIDICSIILSESITDRSCLKYWRFAKNNLIHSLEQKCFSYIAGNADHLFERSLMSDLTIEEMRSLLAVNRSDLQCNEKKVFGHVWIWAKGKASETKSCSQVFSEVVTLLHFSKLESEFVFQKIFDNEDVLVNTELLNKVTKLTKQKYEDEDGCHLIFHKPTQQLFGLAQNKTFLGLREESTIDKAINLRDSFGYTTFDNKLLICGGENSKSCEFFEPYTQKWKHFPSMKTNKEWHGCSYLDNQIYACGGVRTNIVEIFDLGTGEWNFGPEMLANNCGFGLTEMNGALYAIGGENDNVETLDPRTQKWNIVYSDFQRYYKYLRCISIGPYIYCFTYNRRYIFDTRSNKFCEEIFSRDFNYRCNFCEVDGYIYGLGYRTDSTAKYSLNLIQYQLDGKQEFKKSSGLYNSTDVKSTAIVSLYY